MSETLIPFFDEIRSNLRLTDALDIALVSLIIYSLLVWFKETASRRVVIGLIVLVSVYFSARALDMYLTSLLFNAGFAVLIIVLIVVFQDDLRRMLEAIASWGSMQRFRTHVSRRTNADTLVETLFGLAAIRTGALVVLKGREPLDRHLQGGIPLQGAMSEPLLRSLFDASSPGHDGAVVIDNDRVEKFAVHLPLSNKRIALAGRGTRHAAALGLSECCDALIAVVSEERGVVSLAEDGKLKEVSTAAALKSRIESFLATKHPQERTTNVWRRFITLHWPQKAAATVLAVVAWFVFAYDPATIQRTFVVPIQYRNLSSTLVLDSSAVHEAQLTLSGSERSFRFLEPGNLTVSIDLQEAQPGWHQVDVSDRNIRVPANLELYRIQPRSIRLYLQKKELATGQPAGGDV